MSNGHKIQRTQKCWDFVIDGYLTSGLLSMGKMTTGMCPSLKYAKKNAHFCLRRRAEKKLWVFLRHSGNFSAGAHAYE